MWVAEGADELAFCGKRLVAGTMGGLGLWSDLRHWNTKRVLREWYVSWAWGANRHLVAVGFIRYLDTKGKPPWRHRIKTWVRHSQWNMQRSLNYAATAGKVA